MIEPADGFSFGHSVFCMERTRCYEFTMLSETTRFQRLNALTSVDEIRDERMNDNLVILISYSQSYDRRANLLGGDTSTKCHWARILHKN